MNFIEEVTSNPESPKTYLEILKVLRLEVPIANLLAYFFRPNEKHGLKDLFIRALLSTKHYSLDSKKEDKSLSENLLAEIHYIKNAKVETEVKTYSDTRIDILITTSELVICIEFKINHNLDNPLADYQKFVEEETKFEGKEPIFIVLTPYKKKLQSKALSYFNDNEIETRFTQIILSHFIKNVSELYDKFQVKPNEDIDKILVEKQKFIYNDFIQTIKNRSLKPKQEEVFEKAFKNHSLNEFTAPYIENQKSEYWSEALTKLKIKTFFNKIIKTYQASHNNFKFIQIKKANKIIKVRIIKDKWNIEAWKTSNDKSEGVNNLVLNYNSEYEELEKSIKSHLRLNSE